MSQRSEVRPESEGNMRLNLIRHTVALGLALLLAAVVTMILGVGPASAADGDQTENEECLACHGEPGIQVEFPNGEQVEAHVDSEVFGDSVHGEAGLACIDCHPDKEEGFPHRPVTADSPRVYALQRYTSCSACHFSKYEAQLDSVHERAIEAGNLEAAVCTDCHGAHDVQPAGEPRSAIPQTCRQCHSAIYDVYRESVHGEALLDESNPDVPTCIDCHGVHNIEDPTTAEFRLNSPQLCAGCHADPDLMGKYGISTDVLETYVADFHGTTVTLFEKQAPDHETNKAVCFDCHGIHDIRRTDDPESRVIRENLVETCRQCHPDASENFPAAWASHYIPSREHNPLVFLVNRFYSIFIPAVLGSMGVFVLSDIGRRVARRLFGRSQRNQNDD